MKLYNRELEEIENLERYNRIKNIIEKQIEFLVQAYDIDEQMLRDRAERLAIVERNPKESTYFTEENSYGNTKLEYSKLHKIIETKTNFYLMIAKNQGFILIKENFPEGLEEFLRNIKIS